MFSCHQNPCFSNPCLHDSICLNGYTDKQYLCECQAGYTGEQCEKGKNALEQLETNIHTKVRSKWVLGFVIGEGRGGGMA